MTPNPGNRKWLLYIFPALVTERDSVAITCTTMTHTALTIGPDTKINLKVFKVL